MPAIPHLHPKSWTAIWGATCLLGLGCATTSSPRVGDPIPVERLTETGAMVDASRGYPVAFYANPADQPEVLELDLGLGGTHLQARDWALDLARSLNLVVAKVSLFDERFKAFTPQIFAHDVDNGDRQYKWREPEGGVDFQNTRVARLKLKSFKAAGVTGGVETRSVVEVSIGGFSRAYGCEKLSASSWDVEAFTCLAEKILGDPEFWKAAGKVQ